MKRDLAVALRRRPLRLLGLVGLALAAAVACSKSEDTQDYMPSERGAVQPDAGGDLLSEADACDQLKSAESGARKALGCDKSTLACPGSIRPAGGADCFQYSENSVAGCVALYESFASCEEFALHPCLVTAVSNCDAPPPVAGEAGAGGAPPIPTDPEGSAGTTDTAGAGGA